MRNEIKLKSGITLIFDEKYKLDSIGIFNNGRFIMLVQHEVPTAANSIICPLDELPKLIEELQKLC